jgi:hypothetical protein
VVDDDVAGLADGISSNDSLDGDDLANVGLLSLEKLKGDVGLVPVRVSLKEVLSLGGRHGLVVGRARNTIIKSYIVCEKSNSQ